MNFSCATSCPSSFWSFMYGAFTYAALYEGVVDSFLQFCKPIMPPKVYITLFLFLYGLKIAVKTISKQSKLALTYCSSYCLDLFTLWWNREEDSSSNMEKHDILNKLSKSSIKKEEDEDSLSSLDGDDKLYQEDLDDQYEDGEEDKEMDEDDASEILPSQTMTMRKPRNFDKELNSTF
jgi:hypothetical protein